jgi:hypothetical protein
MEVKKTKKIEKIKLRPHNPHVEANNTLHVTSRELADLARELQENPDKEKTEGRFTIYRQDVSSCYLDLEF